MEENQRNIQAEVETLENRIAELPGGYISRKNIRGRETWYYQWREEGKLKSKYVKRENL